MKRKTITAFIILLITTTSPQSWGKNFCFVQLLSSKNKTAIEKVFSEIKEYPNTFLLKYKSFYTIRVGPFKDYKVCKFRSDYLKEKYKSLKLNPLIVSSHENFPSSKHIIKVFTFKKKKPQPNNPKKKNKDYLLYLQKAKICMGRRDCTNAIKYLTLAIEKNPHNPLLYTYLGYAYAHIGNYTKAFDSFRKALEINPNFAEGYAGMGYLYLQLHAPNAAAVAFKKAYELNPKNIVYGVNYAVSLLEAKKYSQSLNLFKKLKQEYPFIPEIYFNEALLLIKTNNLSKAADDLKLFLEMTKTNKYYKPYRKVAKELLQRINFLTQGRHEKDANFQ